MDNDGVTACRYLTTHASAEYAKGECQGYFGAAHLRAGGRPVTDDAQLDQLHYAAHGRVVTVSGRRFVLARDAGRALGVPGAARTMARGRRNPAADLSLVYTGRRMSGLRSFVTAHLGSRQVARVTYGAIIGLALVVALQSHPPTNRIVIASLIGTALAVALAEVYAELLGGETRLRRRPTSEEVSEVVVDGIAVAGGVGFPTVFFILAAAGAIETDLAFNLAKWTGLGLIAFYGYWAGRLSGATPRGAAVQALAVALIGAALIALKAVLH